MSQHLVRYLDLSCKVKNCQKLGVLLGGLEKHRELVWSEKKERVEAEWGQQAGLPNSSDFLCISILIAFHCLIRSSTLENSQQLSFCTLARLIMIWLLAV